MLLHGALEVAAQPRVLLESINNSSTCDKKYPRVAKLVLKKSIRHDISVFMYRQGARICTSSNMYFDGKRCINLHYSLQFSQ